MVPALFISPAAKGTQYTAAYHRPEAWLAHERIRRFDTRTGKRLAGDTEESIYQLFGLSYIPPEQRTGGNELVRRALTKRYQNNFTIQNRVQLIRGGSGYFELLLRLIADATDSIHLQTYIFEDDETGNRVAAALKDAAGRKVSVYLMADGYASRKLPGFLHPGVKGCRHPCPLFEPVFRSNDFYFGRRVP